MDPGLPNPLWHFAHFGISVACFYNTLFFIEPKVVVIIITLTFRAAYSNWVLPNSPWVIMGGRTLRTLTVRTRRLSPGQFVPRTVRPRTRGPRTVSPLGFGFLLSSRQLNSIACYWGVRVNVYCLCKVMFIVGWIPRFLCFIISSNGTVKVSILWLWFSSPSVLHLVDFLEILRYILEGWSFFIISWRRL